MPGKPKFVTTNERIMADGKPLMVPGGLTAPRLIDWNGDGLFDLVCGSFAGGVYLYLNTGKPGQPVFGAPQVLIPPPETSGSAPTEPTRPTEGCYVDVVDYDGDGKLDLLVGGYSTWSPVRKALTPAEKKEADELEKQIRTLGEALRNLVQEAHDQAKGDKAEYRRRYLELVKTEPYKKASQQFQAASGRLEELRPQPQREAFVWLYRRK
jgi:hypothetical protein